MIEQQSTLFSLTHDVSCHSADQHHHHHDHTGESIHREGHHLLQVEDLSVSFRMYDPTAKSYLGAQRILVPIIHDLSVSIHEGEMLAVVGASGSGKTLLADSILGLYEPNALVSGRIWFDGVAQTPESLRALRGSDIGFVPQGVAGLDPLMKVGRQVRETSGTKGRRKARQRQQALFTHYGLQRDVENLYPHQLSGGMIRRVLLSAALMGSPRMIIADEPTPGLDLDQAIQVLSDLRDYVDEGGAVMLITHDIELALRVADRVAVFHDGTVVEETSVAAFASPDRLHHSFSKALWYALPEHDFTVCGEPLC